MVSGLAIIRDGARQALALDDPAFADGWHAVEQEAASAWRWTDGDADIALAGPCELEFCVEADAEQWDAPAAGRPGRSYPSAPSPDFLHDREARQESGGAESRQLATASSLAAAGALA